MNTFETDSGNASAGYTLIEILIALTIFSIGILAVASMQIAAIKGNASANWVTEGAAWAADRIESLMAQPYNSADLNPAGNPHQANSGMYNIVWNVTDNGNSTKTVRVSVGWTEGNLNRNVGLDFLVADL